MNLPREILVSIIGTFATAVILAQYSGFSKLVLSWLQSVKDQVLQNPLLATLLLITTVQLLISILALLIREISNEKEERPEIIFSNKIILRKVKRGKRTLSLERSFALSPKILIKNHVELFDTRMTLFYAIYKQRVDDDINIDRDGVEEVTSEAYYVVNVHRYSFYSDELPINILKRIVTALGIPNNDRITIILTGLYGKKQRRFYERHEYLLADIVLADDSPKVIEYSIRDYQLMIDIPDCDKLHSVIPLSDEENRRRIDELKQVVDILNIESP